MGLIALAQSDMKKLIAYSSVAHMGFVTLGMFGIYLIPSDVGALAFNGAMIQMISHAFGSGAMFLAFGMIYARLHTRAISDFGGLTKHMPYLAAFFMISQWQTWGCQARLVCRKILVLVAFSRHILDCSNSWAHAYYQCQLHALDVSSGFLWSGDK